MPLRISRFFLSLRTAGAFFYYNLLHKPVFRNIYALYGLFRDKLGLRGVIGHVFSNRSLKWSHCLT
jgi:hypothetical protein